MTPAQLSAVRDARPTDRAWLKRWFRAYTGVTIADKAVCLGHSAPLDPLEAQCVRREPITLTLGSRGSGKSFGAALATHADSRFHRNHGTRILGGSLDQSRQIYEALKRHVQDGGGFLGSDAESIASLQVRRALYRNGSDVAILAAASTSVRGPHVPTLRLDEVDEIDPGLREDAMGMMQGRGGLKGMVAMTSTWHRPHGPMADLVGRARAGEFPIYTYCAFEVLKRCPESRSGSRLEYCPACPIVRWCHEDRLRDPSRPPKAKISDGHYEIEDLITASRTTSSRVFEADYLCKGPRADGLWFPRFDRARHVHPSAEYDPHLKVHLAIDSGNRTGAAWFQVREAGPHAHHINVFADYYSDGASAEANARSIVRVGQERCHGLRHHASTDPAGKSRTAIGPSVLAEYARSGLPNLEAWPGNTPVPDSLALLESFVEDATGKVWLTIHPRCTHLISAFECYRRGGKAPQWSDMPLDPQHPAEDLIDALRGGLCHHYPHGRRPPIAGKPGTLASVAY